MMCPKFSSNTTETVRVAGRGKGRRIKGERIKEKG